MSFEKAVEEKTRAAIIGSLHAGRKAKVKKSFHEPLKTALRCPTNEENIYFGRSSQY
jgi:hypothetical protein